MKLFKGMLLFVVAFLFACILIFTFTQEPFKQLVPARIFTWLTPAIPIYVYVAGAFGVGLFIGLCTTLYYYIVLRAKQHHMTKTLHEIEEQLVEARRTIEQYRPSQISDDAVTPAASKDAGAPNAGEDREMDNSSGIVQ
jgi:uncharacterized membrane protein YciS (DUF1049 family)